NTCSATTPFPNDPARVGLAPGLPPPAINNITAVSGGDSRIGVALGFGSEYALTQSWSAKAEYNYMNFGSRLVLFSDGNTARIRDEINAVKVGVNYRFASGTGY